MSDTRKLEELIVYITGKSYGDKHFGSVKLNKVLLNADQFYFARTGKSISGQAYKKHAQGPVPKDMVEAMNRLKEANAVSVRQLPAARGFTRNAIFATRAADLTMFSAEEIAFLTEVVEDLKDVNCSVLSEESHGAAWQNADLYEELPLGSIFYPSRYEATEGDRQRGLELMSKHSWREQYGWTALA